MAAEPLHGVKNMSAQVGSRPYQEATARLPLVRNFLEARYRKAFFAHHALTHHLYRGVYRTFDEAQASIPPANSCGYDNSESADLYRDRTHRIFINDYPMIYWPLRRLATARPVRLDRGGD